MEINGRRFSGVEALREQHLEVSLQESNQPLGRVYRMMVRNTGSRAQVIDRAGMVPVVPTGQGGRRWRVFLDSGVSGWAGVKRLDALAPDSRLQPVEMPREQGEALRAHRSNLQTVLWDAASGQSLLTGFLRQRFGRNFVDVGVNATASDVVAVEAWQEFGWSVPPGGGQWLDPLMVADGMDPYALLEQFGSAVREHQGRVFNAPPITGMMTWYGYRTAITEEMVLANARIIADLFGGYPQRTRNLMLCDHGWQEDANWGYWKADKKRFPHGMKWLAGQLAKEGIDLGLWYTPFCLTDNAANYTALEPFRARGADGQPRRKQVSVWGDLPGQPLTWPVSVMDGGREEVREIWRETLAEMRGWGVRYWKLDFFSLQTSASQERRLGAGELYASSWRSFREGAGEDGELAPCSGPTNLQLGYNDSVRIASDIGNAGQWPAELESFRYGMGTVAALWYKNRKFWVNDADSIQIGRGASLSEVRVRATVVALSGGHLMLSEDLRFVDAERLEMVRRLLPPYPEAARPLDLFENPSPEGYPALWSLRLQGGFGWITVLAVFNLSNTGRQFEIRPEMLGIEPGQPFLALEWWQYRWLGRFQSTFVAEVPAQDVLVIHARPVGETPSLLSVSHHITGGYIVENVWFDHGTSELKGEVVTKPGVRLVLFGYLPRQWALAKESTFHATASPFGGWQSELQTTGSRTPFAIRFMHRQ
ncbi:MAG: alpha-galactosidase [Acidobacteriaceae bacterium]|nr:alpha-galactosidase [Acidobacteriaceae bacterium]